jgi:hypothetical protein
MIGEDASNSLSDGSSPIMEEAGTVRAASIDQFAVARWRLESLALGPTVQAGAAEVVQRLGAVQAQDYGPAKPPVGERFCPRPC